MSLPLRVRRHPGPSSVSCSGHASRDTSGVAGVLAPLAATLIAACTGGGMGGAKIARSADHAAASPSAAWERSSDVAIARPGDEPQAERPGLGTSWGEAVAAPISFAPFVRAAPSPWAELVLHYNDAEGVAAHADYLGAPPAPLEVYAEGGALSVALVDEAGRILPGVSAAGRTLIVGAHGQRYRIVVRNATPVRFEVVASVDGLDVLDGQPADPGRRGYLIDPHGVLAIDGFRTSDDAVAAFRFGTVADSYAAQVGQPFGDRNVGVIGLAIFAERGAAWSPAELGRRDTADPFPVRGYATPPR